MLLRLLLLVFLFGVIPYGISVGVRDKCRFNLYDTTLTMEQIKQVCP